jgi:hypothetical protein
MNKPEHVKRLLDSYKRFVKKELIIRSGNMKTDFELIEKADTDIRTELNNISGLFNKAVMYLKEIFIVHLDTTMNLPQSNAKLFKMFDDGKISLVAQTQLDGNIGSYGNIKTERVEINYPVRIYIDANKGESQMITEMVYWDGSTGTLTAPLLNTQTQSNTLTLRNERIPSMDINNDGIIEIPTQVFLPGAIIYQQDDNKTGTIYLTNWLQVQDSGEAIIITQSVINVLGNYMIDIPKDFIDKISVIAYGKDSQWDICLYDQSTETFGKALFSVKIFTAEEWVNRNSSVSGYFEIINQNQSIVAVSISQEGVKNKIDEVFINRHITFFQGE